MKRLIISAEPPLSTPQDRGRTDEDVQQAGFLGITEAGLRRRR